MIGDTDLKISKLYGMLPASVEGTSEGRTPADNQTVRNVFVIGSDKKIKLTGVQRPDFLFDLQKTRLVVVNGHDRPPRLNVSCRGHWHCDLTADGSAIDVTYI
jgi:hypothetical protein